MCKFPHLHSTRHNQATIWIRAEASVYNENEAPGRVFSQAPKHLAWETVEQWSWFRIKHSHTQLHVKGIYGLNICYEAQDIQKENGKTTPFTQVSAIFSEIRSRLVLPSSREVKVFLLRLHHFFSCNHTEELTLHLRKLLWDHSLKQGRNANLTDEQFLLSSQNTWKLCCPLVLRTAMHTPRRFRWENPSLLQYWEGRKEGQRPPSITLCALYRQQSTPADFSVSPHPQSQHQENPGNVLK